MKIEDLQAYEIVQKRQIADLKSESWLLKHKKTGARIALLSNEDENKVFYIGFRTPPTDSTGVAHILEHSVLCGSEHFPVRDPFIELAKGSLNTFLNAMTYPDKTVYPVASCNDKDFQNLVHVYLDAVFYPNIYKEEKIFRQEGWHYELEDIGDELTVNGVVYNEMKGAFSSPDDVMEREMFNSLFPDTTYGYESGGDPQVIPTLTYEEFLDFHRRYYHPSNSYIYLYGNMDMAEKLEFLDREYLSAFDALHIDSEIETQKAFEKPVYVKKEYAITENEEEKDNTYLSYNVIVGDSLDPELYIAFQVLDYVLCSAPGAPLKQALIDKKIGKDVYSIYDNGVKQPYFSIVAKNANEGQQEEFIRTIEEVLKGLVHNGLDRKALRAALNYYEFKYREADFGSYPKGLMYGLQMFDSWLYDENAPFSHIEANATFASLKEKATSGYYEELITRYLLNNPHKSYVMLVPKKGLTTERENQQKELLLAYRSRLTEEELQTIVEETKALKEYQEAEDDPETLKCIPLLTREDIRKTAEGFINEKRQSGSTDILFHDIFTNGIGYVKLLFDIKKLPQELLPYAALLKAVLGLMDTEHYSYGELFNEINVSTGGISTAVNTYTNARNLKEYRACFEIRAKVLYENLDKAFELMQEMLTTTKYADEKRLFELIEETKSRMQAGFISAGHSLAAVRAMGYFSEVAALSGQMSGIPFYRLLERLEQDFENEKDRIAEKLQQTAELIFTAENLMVDYTAEEEGCDRLPELTEKLKESLFTGRTEKTEFVLVPEKKNEGFQASSQVQFVCRAGNFVTKGLPYTGALRVLRVMMGYDYLWTNVRVKGGAYGCMCNFGKNGDSYFVSYRDPNLEKTIEVYEKAADYIAAYQADERTIMQYIIGAISELDIPMTPATKGARSLGAWMSGQTAEDVQKERDELLSVDEEKIRALSAYVKAFLSDECLCVVGNDEKLNSQSSLFEHMENLFA
ncbi:MAG: insulinase family protein [Lachnospiraceae bacterium]|nr:insulinase family protein [Lachnospiraceae bacterium]